MLISKSPKNNNNRTSLSTELVLVDQSRFQSKPNTPSKTKERMIKAQTQALILVRLDPTSQARKSVIDQAKDLAQRQSRLQTLKNCADLIKKRTYTKDLNALTAHQKCLLDDPSSMYVNETATHNMDDRQVDEQQDENKIVSFPRQETKDRFVKFIHYLIDVRIRNKLRILSQYERFIKLMMTTFQPTNPFIVFWNSLITCVIFHNIFIVPLQDAFDADFQKIECSQMLWLIQFEFFACIFDILIQFNVSVMKEGNMIRKKNEIAKHYIENGFYYDIMGLMGFVANRLSFLVGGDCTQSTNILQSLAKYAFLFKRHRLRRVVSFFKQFIKTKTAKNYFLLMELLILVIVMAHYIACYWILAAQFSNEYFDNTWIQSQQASTLPNYWIYLKSVYFAAMTMTTVGYGDILPKNPIEYGACICIMVFSCGFFAYSLNTITSILIDNENQQQKYKKEIEIMENYMLRRKIDPHLQSRVKSYLKSIEKAGFNDNYEDEQNVISKLSNQLQIDLLLQDKGKIFHQIGIFKDNFSEEFILKLIDKLHEVRISPGETVKFTDISGKPYPTGCFFYLDQGHLDIVFEKRIQRHKYIKGSEDIHNTKIATIRQGGHFGLSYLFGKQDNHSFKLKSTGFSVLYTICKDDFEEILRCDPQGHESQRFCQLRDKISMYSDYGSLNSQCIICGQSDHEFDKCSTFFLQPLKRHIISKHEYSVPMTRQKFTRTPYPKVSTLQIYWRSKHIASLLDDEEDQLEKLDFGDGKSIIKEESDELNFSDDKQASHESERLLSQHFHNQEVDVYLNTMDQSISSWLVPESGDRRLNTITLGSMKPKKFKQLGQQNRQTEPDRLPVKKLKNSFLRIAATNTAAQSPRDDLKVQQLTPPLPTKFKPLIKLKSKPPIMKESLLQGAETSKGAPRSSSQRGTPQGEKQIYFHDKNPSIDQNQLEELETVCLYQDVVFNGFDKLKEYPIYFPHNNFSHLIKKIGRQKTRRHRSNRTTFSPKRRMI